MKRFMKIICALLSGIMILGTGLTPLYAEKISSSQTGNEEARPEETEAGELIFNPIYSDAIDKDSLIQELEAVTEGADGISLYAAEPQYSTLAQAKGYVREQMVNRANNFSFQIPSNLYSAENANEIFHGAMEYSAACSGQEGDALSFAWSGMTCRVSSSSSGWTTLTYTVVYYSTYEEERTLTTAVNQAMASLALGSLSEYEKVKKIHDYICDTVDYDYSYSKYSAYNALCQKSAVCQGYAILFYRMCKEAGLSVRIVTGIGNGGAHAWNIVKIGNYYYNVDCTWDGQGTTTYQTYFLKSQSDFGDHERDADYTTAAFHSAYPMSPVSWQDSNDSSYTINNLSYNYTTIRNTTVSSTASSKPKLLIFFNTGCGNSQTTIWDICNRKISGVDIIAAEIYKHTKEEVAAFQSTYGNDTVTFAYSTSDSNSSSMWAYVKAVGLGGANNRVSLPVIIYIDANNKIRYATQGYIDAGTVQENLVKYCGGRALSLAETAVSMNAGDTYILSGYINGEKQNGSAFQWSSDNEAVARVDRNGKITATGAGNCVITCKSTDAGTATVQIKVSGSTNTNENMGQNGLAQASDGNWYYYTNGRIDTNYTGMALNEYGWWYVRNGVLDWNYTGMALNEYGWWYFNNGQLDWNYTGMALNEYGWWYFNNGQLDWNYTGMALNEYGWWYFRNGQLDWNYTGMALNEYGWWYFRNGQLDWGYTGMALNEYGWWYFNNGQLDWNYTGMALNEYGWWYFRNGALDWNYTGMALNEYGWWYFNNGQLDWTYTGIGWNEYGAWYYADGRIRFDYTGPVVLNGIEYQVSGGMIV